ncbi:MAG: hypothetical protein LBN39_02580 [Planctomycetaceae bacterium]|jgi:hypothetical protein|nr:hypothetical protein [Planctomycetaceae bacterium]
MYKKQLIFLILFSSALTVCAAGLPVNLAPLADITATSEYNADYAVKNVADGVIPPAGSQSADLKHSWCVNNASAKNQAEITFRWKQPVEISEAVYFGRTSWFMNECFKDYEIFTNGNGLKPAASGSFAVKHGAQSIKFPKIKTDRLTIKFLNAHGGPNPGAAEIMLFAEPLPAKQLRSIYNDNSAPALSELSKTEQDYLLDGLGKFIAVKRYEINSSHVYTYHYEGFRSGGGIYVSGVVRNADGTSSAANLRCIVDAGQGQILNADVSYDGKTILFSWRKSQNEPYQIFTCGLDGKNIRQITAGKEFEHCHNYDCCFLPDGDIAFLSSCSPQFAYCWNAPVGVLHRMSLDGSNLIRLSDNYLNDFTPNVLDDGRIIYGRWEYVDRPAIPIQSLWTIRPDGTNLQTFFGNRVLSPATFMEAHSIPGTEKVLCTMTGHNGIVRGAVGIIDRRYGDNSQPSIENITPDVPVAKVNEGDGNYWRVRKYCSPYPLDGERYLVSNEGNVDIRTYELRNSVPKSQVRLLDKPDNGMMWFNPMPVRQRTVSSVARNADGGLKSAPDKYATLAVQDVYQGLTNVNRGEIKNIRIVQEMPKTVRIEPNYRSFGFQFPVISCGATYAGKLILGDVPVEADGSAYFKVGGNAWRGTDSSRPSSAVGEPVTGPIYFIALDSEGRAVQRMRSFTHLMSGEQQTCAGCHEERTTSPNIPLQHLKAVRKDPAEPRIPDWAKPDKDRAAFAPGFDYVRIIQPIWNKHCVECHNETSDVDLTGDYTEFFNVSYDVLASENQGKSGSPFVNWIPTYNGDEQNILNIVPKAHGSYQSKLAELIRSRHADKNSQYRINLSDAEKQAVYAWIDLNVPYYPSSETAYPENIGSRRLYPAPLDAVLNEVGQRRCAECHHNGNEKRLAWLRRTDNQTPEPESRSKGIVPRRSWVRITNPQLNEFLTAPLAKSAGGTERCGKIIFIDKSDADYVKILKTFDDVQTAIKQKPRIDMPNGKPAENVCRLTY